MDPFPNRRNAYLGAMSQLAAVAALMLGPVFGFGTITREMTHLLAIATDNSIGIARLVTLLGHVLGRSTVAAGTRSNVRTL
jgi:hypothetical protein